MGATGQSHSFGKIIYIMGPARCGTTLLEVLLTNSYGITGCGEVTHIFRDGFLSNQQCACGEAVSECKVWSKLLQKSDWDLVKLSRLRELFALFSAHKYFPLIYLGLLGKTRRAEYAEANKTLFTLMADITQNRVIVDSSKYAGRALELAAQHPDKVSIIAITREPAGVLHSFSKLVAEQEPKSIPATLLYYCYVLLCMRLVCWRLGRKVKTISYESLCAAPAKVLQEIEDFCGISLQETRARLNSGKPLNIGHIVTGNRFRHERAIEFRCIPEVKTLPAGARLAAILMRAWRRLLIQESS